VKKVLCHWPQGAKITAGKAVIILTVIWFHIDKTFFSSSLLLQQNKLECLSFSSVSRLV
jgi:hypothetical protein